jgi:Rad3-related DNA helicase
MSQAARTIVEISTHMDCVYDAEKVIIFCGNLGTHAASLYKILGDDDCILHQSGQLAESLERYKQSPKKYFLVAGAEWGLDAGFCKLQFLLKHPFPNLDERARTLQRVMGPGFNSYYEGEARNRVTQTFGRNSRGFGDFGITVCLDTKTLEDYQKNKQCYPEWLQQRIDDRVY